MSIKCLLTFIRDHTCSVSSSYSCQNEYSPCLNPAYFEMQKWTKIKYLKIVCLCVFHSWVSVYSLLSALNKSTDIRNHSLPREAKAAAGCCFKKNLWLPAASQGQKRGGQEHYTTVVREDIQTKLFVFMNTLLDQARFFIVLYFYPLRSVCSLHCSLQITFAWLEQIAASTGLNPNILLKFRDLCKDNISLYGAVPQYSRGLRHQRLQMLT